MALKCAPKKFFDLFELFPARAAGELLLPIFDLSELAAGKTSALEDCKDDVGLGLVCNVAGQDGEQNRQRR